MWLSTARSEKRGNVSPSPCKGATPGSLVPRTHRRHQPLLAVVQNCEQTIVKIPLDADADTNWPSFNITALMGLT
jgi:hypothetical protein